MYTRLKGRPQVGRIENQDDAYDQHLFMRWVSKLLGIATCRLNRNAAFGEPKTWTRRSKEARAVSDKRSMVSMVRLAHFRSIEDSA